MIGDGGVWPARWSAQPGLVVRSRVRTRLSIGFSAAWPRASARAGAARGGVAVGPSRRGGDDLSAQRRAEGNGVPVAGKDSGRTQQVVRHAGTDRPGAVGGKAA